MPELIFSDKPVAYPDAIAFMEQRVADIVADKAPECLWFLEHPPLYTAGTSANPDDLLQSDRFPVYEAKRGGEYTYHGPGQRVVYLMLDLRKRGRDVRRFVQQAENWVIQTLDDFNIRLTSPKGALVFGCRAPIRAMSAKTKSRPLACVFAAGSAFMAFRLMLNRSLSILAALCHAALATKASPAWLI